MRRAFNHHQYVPVLRWKSSEREALCKLDPNVKKRITPIFELVPQDFKKMSTAAALKKQTKQIAECLSLTRTDGHLGGGALNRKRT